MERREGSRYRKLPCLDRPREYSTSTNPPPGVRAPCNCEELGSYIESVKLLGRVREEDWHTFCPLVDLANSRVWRWQPNLHDTLLSHFHHLSGILFAPEGICVYPHITKKSPVLLLASQQISCVTLTRSLHIS
jgi:hypothetical protein